MLRVLRADEAEEGMYGRQPHVACARFVFAGRFEVLKERYDPVDREMFHLKEGRILVFASGVFQKQLEAVAVAMEGVGTQGLLLKKRCRAWANVVTEVSFTAGLL